MKIEAGKRYVTREGVIRGPMQQRTDDNDGCGGFTWKFPWACDGRNSYRNDGRMSCDGAPHECDLVAEYVEPVADGPGSARSLVGAEVPSRTMLGTDDPYEAAALDTLAEIRRAKALWPRDFASAHEGWAIIAEEFNKELWEHVCMNQKRRNPAAMRKEALQVAAMALRFAVECCTEEACRK